MAVTHHDVYRQAALDPDFRARLIADPVATLTDFGVDVSPGVRVTVVEDTQEEMFVAVPPPHPNDALELSDDALEQVAGGTSCHGSAGWIAQSTVSIGMGCAN